MEALLAKAKRGAIKAPEPQPLVLAGATNQSPLASRVDDSTDVSRLEPTPIGQMRPAPAGVLPSYAEYQETMAGPESPSKRQRRDEPQPQRNSRFEESKFNVGVVHQLLPGGGGGGGQSLREARSELLDQQARRSSLVSTGNDDDLWQLGMFALSDRSDISMPGLASMPSLALPLQDFEPTPLQLHQDQGQPQGQFVLERQHQQYEAEDQLQQEILRQIEEQQRQLLQQRQEILQRQQMQLQQRQNLMNSVFHEHREPLASSQNQQPPQQSLQQQTIGLSDHHLFPFQQQQQQQDERLVIMSDYQQRREQQQQDESRAQQHMQRFSKYG